MILEEVLNEILLGKLEEEYWQNMAEIIAQRDERYWEWWVEQNKN